MEETLKITANDINIEPRVLVSITCKNRSWNTVREIINKWRRDIGYGNLDLRKSSKKVVPLLISTDCCGSKLEVRRVKDFPLQDLKCKCGKSFIIKWNNTK